MKLFYVTKLEAIAITSVPLAFGLALGALAVYLAIRPRRSSRIDEQVAEDILQHSTR